MADRKVSTPQIKIVCLASTLMNLSTAPAVHLLPLLINFKLCGFKLNAFGKIMDWLMQK